MMCQRPERAYFISTYSMEKRRYFGMLGVSTPWTGLLHFYFMKKLTTVWTVCVSTPWTGLLHFYVPCSKDQDERIVCQRPERAYFISTEVIDSWVVKPVLCQRPERAYFISTVPSKTPWKHWLSSLIFAGICQTILKTAVFCWFFGMFIICSYLELIFCQFSPPHYILR